jgi:HPt (histidine-containing phosphotransfer) domain-containing protein
MTASPIDQTVLAKLEKIGGTALVARIIDAFLQHSPERVAAIVAAQASGDWGAVERAAHSLISSSGQLGAAGLSELSRRLESAARQGDGALVTSLTPEVQRLYAAVCAGLQGIRNGVGG